MSVVDTHYRRRPGEVKAKYERRAAIARKAMATAALKAAALPPSKPVTSPVVRRKSSKR